MSRNNEKLLRIKRESLMILEGQGYDVAHEKSRFFDPRMNSYTINGEDNPVTWYPETYPQSYVGGVLRIDYNQVSGNRRMRESQKGRFVDSIRPMMSSYFVKRDDSGKVIDGIVVFFASSTKESTVLSEVSEFTRLLLEYGCSAGMFIMKRPLAAGSATSEMASISGDWSSVPEKVDSTPRAHRGIANLHIQKYMDEELTYSPEDNIYTGRYTLLSHAEKMLLIKGREDAGNDDPIIFDPNRFIREPTTTINARRLGARRGDIIKIVRQSLIPGTLVDTEVVYRVVVVLPPEKKKKKSTAKE